MGDINHSFEGGLTLLHMAVLSGRPGAVRWLLLERGADPNVRDSRGLTPAMMAAIRGCREMYDEFRQDYRTDWGKDDGEGWTAEMFARETGLAS